ncbi:family 20 glycoside hydrolase [Cryphonectria parasitica EP155]|uniref:Beta-hexosaminidase n=1 Tax=Cryphonectria parasitica (strain ATCC 38755 / EP155) TaxID=660469 RepID=A0A9P4XX65_CRYP1|nr:family 20 glycoside hydrolase [Cryphonectria parasitica EP155]KAF3762982.1 family 20 glycoside hydrolase [Cryphonectria parasitica EP155]
MGLRLLLPVVLAAVDSVTAQGLGGLWPVPQPTFSSGNTSLFINEDIQVTLNGASLTYTADYEPSSLSSAQLVQAGVSRTLDSIFSANFVPWMLVPRYKLSSYEPALNASAASVTSLAITLTSSNATFQPSTAEVDESYNLTISETGSASLSAVSTSGVLHGLETFSQLFYEHSSGTAWYMVNAPIEIQDKPVYAWRGVMLDTARNFFPVDDIKRTIDGLSYSKLNKLHVHVTDSQSWPLEVPSLPDLSGKGAYSQAQVYSADDIQSLQEYGIARGVDVYFEIDMPGHIGVVGEAYPDLVVAYDAQPYTTYCAEPPCGALRLNNSGVEDLLGTLFDDVLPRVAPYTAYWHTGGDELNAQDYLLDPDVNTNDTAVLQPLLQDFIDTQHTRVRDAGLNPMVWEEIVTTWNVTLGSDVVVQSWLGGTAVPDLAANGYKVIDSNYEFYYLDCGRGQWVTWSNDLWSTGYPFNDWCSPTKSWELIYSHDPAAGVSANATSNVLGGELALWSETIDPQNLDSLAWPRAAAAAEVLWSGRTDAAGQNRSQVDAAPRLNSLRQRLVARGLGASPIQMEWCTMYPNATGCAQPA